MQSARFLACCLVLLSACALPVDSTEAESEELEVEGRSQALLANWQSSGTVSDASPTSYGRFGRTVSVAGDRVVVTRQAVSSASLGTTQVFARSNGWYRQHTVTTPIERFPVAALGGRWLIVGEPCGSTANGCRGRVRAWSWSSYGWSEYINVNDASLPHDFGRALSFDGTNLFVVGGSSVYHYVINDPYWITLIRVYAAPFTSYTSAAYGYSIAASNGYLAVSAPSGYRNVNGVMRGSPGYVHVYNTQTGALVQTLTGVGSEIGASSPLAFGGSVSMSGTRLVVAAPFENGAARTVYAYRRGADGLYVLNATLPQPASTGYATYVAVDGANLAVTTSAPAGAATGVLRMYEFARFGVSLVAEYGLGSDWAPVAIGGSRVAVGQPATSSNRGVVLTYHNPPPVLDPGVLAP